MTEIESLHVASCMKDVHIRRITNQLNKKEILLEEAKEKTRDALAHVLSQTPWNEGEINDWEPLGEGNFDSDVFAVTLIKEDTRDAVELVLKIAKRVAPKDIEASREDNEKHRQRLNEVIHPDRQIETFTKKVEWQGDKAPRETIALIQPRIPNATPLAKTSLKEIQQDPTLARNTAELFRELITLIESAEKIEDLPDLWGLEQFFRCGVMLDPIATHNILISKDTKQAVLVDDARCASFYLNKPRSIKDAFLLGGRAFAYTYFKMFGKKRWIKRLTSAIEILEGCSQQAEKKELALPA